MGENHGKTEFDGRPGNVWDQSSQRTGEWPASLLGWIAGDSSWRDLCFSVADRYACLGNHVTGSYAQGGRESRVETDGADGSGLESAAHSAGPDFGYGAREFAGKLHTECLRQLQMQLYHDGKR